MASSSTNDARAAILASTTVKWQVQFPSGWQDLPLEATYKIEAARLGGENVACYKQCRSQKRDLWQPYQLDFGTMQQTNISSGRVRRARRIDDDGVVREVYHAMPIDEPIDSIEELLPIEDWLGQDPGSEERATRASNKIPKTDANAVGILYIRR